MDPQRRMEVQCDDAVAVVTMTGEYDLVNAPELDACLLRLAGHVVALDMAEVTFIDSATINTIVQARSRGLDLSVRNPSRVVRRAMELCGLSELLPPD